MTPAPNPLPEELAEHAFPSSRAAKLGVTPKMLRGRRYTQLHHGVHAFAHRENGREGFAEKVMLRVARDYLPLLRDGEAFSHTSALLLYEAPILAEPNLHVTAALPKAAAAGRHVSGHRTRHGFKLVFTHQDLPCVPPELALAQSESLLSFRELVVAIDHLIVPRRDGRAAEPLLARERLGEYLTAYSGKGGGAAACSVRYCEDRR